MFIRQGSWSHNITTGIYKNSWVRIPIWISTIANEMSHPSKEFFYKNSPAISWVIGKFRLIASISQR